MDTAIEVTHPVLDAKSLGDAIDDVLRTFNSRQSYFGRGEIDERYLPGLRSMLVLAIQHHFSTLLNAFEETANTTESADPSESVERGLSIIKYLLKRLTIDGSISFSEEDLWIADDFYLVIEDKGLGVTQLSLTDKPPSDEPEPKAD